MLQLSSLEFVVTVPSPGRAHHLPRFFCFFGFSTQPFLLVSASLLHRTLALYKQTIKQTKYVLRSCHLNVCSRASIFCPMELEQIEASWSPILVQAWSRSRLPQCNVYQDCCHPSILCSFLTSVIVHLIFVSARAVHRCAPAVLSPIRIVWELL